MQRRSGSAGAAIQRRQKYIESELKAGKSKQKVRLELIARGAIPEVSRAYFNEVVGDFSASGPEGNPELARVRPRDDVQAAGDGRDTAERPTPPSPSNERRGGNYVDDRFDNAL